MFSFLNNLPQVTKNLLILNVLFFVGALVFAGKGIDVFSLLGTHYLNSPLFKPFQIITYMFMHSLSDFTHILFNMLILVMFGGHLERLWGPKRFFIFYFASGLGAFLLYNSIGMWELMQLKKTIMQLGIDIDIVNHKIRAGYIDQIVYQTPEQGVALQRYYDLSTSTMAGASGALFGVMAGFAVLFPNTELMLLFPPIPVKAKYLIGAYLIFEIYSSLYASNDHVAHLAHVGGAIVGIILVLIWRKTDRNNFW
ncbi:MAG: rhomboid family intramembrane serine protease [Flavobacteriia bacterium]